MVAPAAVLSLLGGGVSSAATSVAINVCYAQSTGALRYMTSPTSCTSAKYRQVLGVDAAYEPALFNLAILVQSNGDNAGAIALYRRAINAAPKDASAHLNLGLLLRSSGQKAAGNKEVKLAITLNPKLVDPTSKAVTPTPAAKQSPSAAATS